MKKCTICKDDPNPAQEIDSREKHTPEPGVMDSHETDILTLKCGHRIQVIRTHYTDVDHYHCFVCKQGTK